MSSRVTVSTTPLLAAYRTIAQGNFVVPAGVTAAGSPYIATQAGTAIGVAATTVAANQFYFDAADYAIAGKTTVLRYRVQLETNDVAPLSTFTIRPRLISAVTAAAGTLTYTSANVGSHGSGNAFVAPAANTLNTVVTADNATALTTGNYLMGCTIGVATTAANSLTHITYQVQLRHI